MTLLSSFELTADETLNLQEEPAFRRATANMVMACRACEVVLSSLPQGTPKDQVSSLFCTNFGENLTSLEFLNTYYETKVPRPILFQNSLHNSTLGFVSRQLNLTGPGFTLSNDYLTEKTPHF